MSHIFILSTSSQVTFELGDVTKIEIEESTYDVIYSRDTILHIPDKEELFKTLSVSLHV